MITNSCLCGQVRWRYEATPASMAHCHCSMCRKHHGAPFVTFLGGPLAGFRWESGESAVRWYQSSAQGARGFCPGCGAKAPTLMAEHDLAIMPAGPLEGDIALRPQMHMFVASKAPWYEITDGLPQHAAFPPEFGMDGVAQPARATRAEAISGGCLCGDVAYEITAAPQRMYNCHCQRCRRARSAAHATNVFYPFESFRWTRGEDRLTHYTLPGARFFGTSFCSRCGSMQPRAAKAHGLVAVPAGSLDTDPGMRPQAHIYVGSKASWFGITDTIPQFTEMPPAP